MNILLVDDDLAVLARLGQLLHGFDLRGRGFNPPRRCQRAARALEIVRRDADGVGLLCCNPHMLDMDLLAFLRELESLRYRGGLMLVGNHSERLLHGAEQIARAYRLRVLGALYMPLGPVRLGPLLDGMLCRVAAPTEHARMEEFPESGQWAFALH